MGPSGSGKTTMLDILAGRKNTGVVTGTILYAGRAATPQFLRRHTGYVEQFGVGQALCSKPGCRWLALWVQHEGMPAALQLTAPLWLHAAGLACNCWAVALHGVWCTRCQPDAA